VSLKARTWARNLGMSVERLPKLKAFIEESYELGVTEGQRLARIERHEAESIAHASSERCTDAITVVAAAIWGEDTADAHALAHAVVAALVARDLLPGARPRPHVPHSLWTSGVDDSPPSFLDAPSGPRVARKSTG
jgi:hypothetical protein